jgi:hypothetical protein
MLYPVVVLTALGIVFLIMGHLAGRLVGAGFLVVALLLVLIAGYSYDLPGKEALKTLRRLERASKRPAKHS